MRLWPASLFGRLLALSTLATLAALLVAGLAIGQVLERFVMRGLDDRLDAQVMVLARAVRPDGTLDQTRAVDLPGFGEPGSGWAWQVDGPGGARWRSAAAPVMTAPQIMPPAGPDHDRQVPDGNPGSRPHPADDRGSRGRDRHFRILSIATRVGPVTIMAAGPRHIVDAPLHEAMVPLLGSLALLGVALSVATLLQLRLGLRPLATLQTALADIRAGRNRHVPTDQPQELQPLVRELNTMIDQNEAGLAHARQHVANLAHGLKTPLAALALKLGEPGMDRDGTLRAMVARIDGRVRHHLGRARAAAPGGAGRKRTPLAPACADLVDVLRRVHADRPLVTTINIAPDILVSVDPRDLDEILGNLLDNGWRHARSAIRFVAVADRAGVAITIEDDGAGLADDAIAEALLPGRRLDERGDGHGFGLPIARELAELNGGTLLLARSEALGGLHVRLSLPSQ